MRRLARRLSILWLLVLPALSPTAWPQAGAPSPYAKLLERVKGGDLSIDFKQLRFSYMDSPEYAAAKDTENETKAMIDAINAEDFAAALKNADAVLASDYVDMDAHFAEYIAHRQLHHDSQAEFHKAVFQDCCARSPIRETVRARRRRTW